MHEYDWIGNAMDWGFRPHKFVSIGARQGPDAMVLCPADPNHYRTKVVVIPTGEIEEVLTTDLRNKVRGDEHFQFHDYMHRTSQDVSA